MEASVPRVLVVGPRPGLGAALRRREIPHVVWNDRDRLASGADHLHVAPLDVSAEQAQREAEQLRAWGPFTHVMAGTESGVIPAAVARRALGARVYAHSTILRGRDKLRMKKYLRRHGVPMTSFLDGNDALPAAEIVAALGTPVVAKERLSSGGRGIEFLHDPAGLDPANIRDRLLEAYVDAPEVSVESFVHEGRILLRNITEYVEKTRVNVVPAGLDATTRQQVLDLNDLVVRTLDLKWGVTHLEAFLTPDGPLFGEIGLRPPGGYIMNLIELAWNFDPWDAMVAAELGDPFPFPPRCSTHAAVIILHPGEGTVKEVRGLDEVRRLASTVSAKVRVRVGDRVSPRSGVGQDVGRVLLRADTRPEILDALATVDSTLEIVVGDPG